jgi:SAM-dependent methyltransferase
MQTHSDDNTAPAENAHTHDERWYQEWFNHHFYLTLYRHRSQADADRAVALFRRAVPLPQGACVLDVCCGAGRHVRALLQAGFAVAGIDLSPRLLEIAREEFSALASTHNHAEVEALRRYHLLQGDMREPLPLAFSERYDAVTNFFTSFGYFHDADNQRALQQMSDALRLGGWLFFDFLNAASLPDTLIAEDTSITDGFSVRQRRSIEDGFVRKHIVITDVSDANDASEPRNTSSEHAAERKTEHSFTEQVRLYTKDDLETMFAAAHLRVQHVCGDYDGSAWSPSSPRTILVAQRVE